VTLARSLALGIALALALAAPPSRGDEPPPGPPEPAQEPAQPPAPAPAPPARSDANEPIAGSPRPDWGLGPLDVADEYLLSLTHLTLGPASPATARAGSVHIIFRGDLAKTIFDNEPLDTTLDAETVHGSLVVRYGLIEALEASIDIPFIWRWEGILDPLIKRVEGAFSSVRGERERLPDNVYRVHGQTDDGVPFEFDDGIGLGKINLGLKWRVFDGEPWGAPAVAIEGIAALPTATPGFGTHGVDLGARLDLAKRVGDFVFYLGGAILYPDGNVGPIRLEPWQGMGFGAVEFEVEPWLAAIYEGWVESPKTINLDRARGLIFYHGGGMKMCWDHFFGEFAIIENGADVKRSADIIFHVEIGVRF
jgi:hypothetical protein